MPLSVDRVLRKASQLAKRGEADLAAQEYRRILELYPNNRLALKRLKQLQRPSQQQIESLTALFNQGRLQETLAQGEMLATQFPATPFIANILGAVCFSLRRMEHAEAHFRRALELKPDYAVAHNNLGNVQNSMGTPKEAVASYEKAISLSPEYAEAHNNLASALNALGRHEEAVSCYRKLLRIKPDSAEAHNDLGITLSILGNRNAAIENYEKALQRRPDFAEAHRNMSEARNYQIGDDHLQQMLQLVDRRGLDDKGQALLNFALGKACDDIGEYDQAFSYLAAGNGLVKAERRYDISSDRALAAKIKSCFAKKVPVLNLDGDVGDQSGRQPVFVLGMPRSGTTLVEQILASHSQVHGAGETGLLAQAIDAAKWDSEQVSSEQLQSIRTSYLSGLANLEASETMVTNKLPINFQWIGFILAAMPEAKIIHVQRDARATCWSIYRNFFSGTGNDFAHDLEDVANYYKLYSDLMAYWHNRFPGEIYDLSYEMLTEQQESETRRLIEFLGLAWEDQCLEYYKTQRAVRTASAVQVRQEMYQGSSDAWRKYEKHLQPMLKTLDSSA